MFDRQLFHWNSLLNSFRPNLDHKEHTFDKDIENMLFIAVNLELCPATFWSACDFWNRYKYRKPKNLVDYDVETLLACILFLTCEVKEASICSREDLTLIVRQLNYKSNFCFFDSTEFKVCLLKILEVLNFDLYSPSLIDQFYHCAFFDSPTCSLRIVDLYTDAHKHENECVDSETCIYERIKLWYDFAVLYGYWRCDYLTLFALFLIKRERICSACLLDIVGGDYRQYFNIVCYGHKMFCHLQQIFDIDDTLWDRYRFPAAWKNGIDNYFCDSCPNCRKRFVDRRNSFALKNVKKSSYSKEILDILPLILRKNGVYGQIYVNYVEKICYKTFFDEPFCREVCLSLALNHENILPIIDCGLSSSGQIWMSTRYHCKDLQHRLECEPIPEALGRKIMHSIAKGLCYMHQNCILHFDLKPCNILCSFDGDQVQLFDFSLSQQAKTCFSPQQYGFNPFVINSLPYRAPELLFYLIEKSTLPYFIYVFAADMWALGCIYYEILQESHRKLVDNGSFTANIALQQIFDLQATNVNLSELRSYKDLPKNLQKNSKSWAKILKNSDINAVDLIDSLLDLNPETRKPASFVIDHPYFNNNRSKNGVSSEKIV